MAEEKQTQKNEEPKPSLYGCPMTGRTTEGLHRGNQLAVAVAALGCSSCPYQQTGSCEGPVPAARKKQPQIPTPPKKVAIVPPATPVAPAPVTPPERYSDPAVDRMMRIIKSLPAGEQATLAPIVDYLKTYTAVTHSDVKARIDRSATTISRYLARLVELGVLRAHGTTRNVIYTLVSP